MHSTTRRWTLRIFTALVLWATISAGTYFAWVRGADHRDFYPWWAGARFVIYEGRDLYDPATVTEMQKLLYGRILPPEVDQQGFAYPAQLLVVLFPFWLIPDREVATAAWQGLSAVMLLASLLLLNRLRGSRMPVWAQVALLIWQYPLLMIFQGQITALILLGQVLAFQAYTGRRYVLSGLAACVGVLKPELSLIPWLVLGWLVFRERRWKWAAAFTGGQAVLFGLSLALAGWWVPGWLGAVQRYAGYAKSTWAPLTLWQLHPLLAAAWLIVIILLLIKTRWNRVAAFAASIPLGVLLLPQTLLWGLTMLLAPLCLAWKGHARWLVALTWVLGWGLIAAPAAWWRYHSVVLASLALLAVWLSEAKAARCQAAPLVLEE